MALMIKRFKKFMKFEKKGFGFKGQDLKKKTPFKKFKPTQEKNTRNGIRCFKCGGIGHISPDCGNLTNKKKGKAMAAIWSESDDLKEGEGSSNDENHVANFIAFAFSHKSNKEVDDKEE
ncbi:hypothetical protein LWI29_030526 [Acer saccharum]|uniref:CCHC-type domain-containing protein n=1 Tax=Acer saccharum TaxID=4024 RepID=A0AA39SQH4_ACESA|nr:hypothetical protein LWI29_030526 [Acer saccharum]